VTGKYNINNLKYVGTDVMSSRQKLLLVTVKALSVYYTILNI
jgi:hypothetical protein